MVTNLVWPLGDEKIGGKKRGKTRSIRSQIRLAPEKGKLTGHTRKARKSRANDRQFQKKRTRGKHQRIVYIKHPNTDRNQNPLRI